MNFEWKLSLLKNQDTKTPSLKCNIPYSFNPYIEEIQHDRIEFLKRIKIFPNETMLNKYICDRCDIMVAGWAPFANKEGLLNMVLLGDLLIILDDLYVETGIYTEDEMRDIFNPKGSNPLSKEFNDILQFFGQKKSDPFIMDLYKKELTQTFVNIIRNDSSHQFTGDLDFNQYQQLRFMDFGTIIFLIAPLLVDDYNINKEIYESDLLYQFFSIGSVPISLSNDIYSFKKESVTNDFKNYVKVVAHQNGYDLQLAFTKCTQIYYEYLDKFDDICNQILEKYKDNKSVIYLIKASQLMQATILYFHETSPRYEK
ncbi:hypothetical protein CYY_000672 [Polysphondylium violaceum]|uniref:Terpenoid synthase n=1 Tax=Polysphondylium violaceum TaxID=133409 RepID=A0A8J4Q384_9MYCE|nr:hypothetical protein CYY_000672 [Polysphondylium violaceum]